VRPPLPLQRGKNEKALINFRKTENDDFDALKARSMKKLKSLLWMPHDHCACSCLRRKSDQWHGIVEIVGLLGWREQSYSFPQANQPKTLRLKYLTKRMAYFFYKLHICFFYLWTKQQTHCIYVLRHTDVKHNVRPRATCLYHCCKYLTHTNKTRQVKITHVVASCNCQVHDSRVCYFFRPLRIESNETIAQKDVRFKPESASESLQ